MKSSGVCDCVFLFVELLWPVKVPADILWDIGNDNPVCVRANVFVSDI